MGPNAFRQALGGLGFTYHSGPGVTGYELWVVASRVKPGEFRTVTIPDTAAMSTEERRDWFERLRQRVADGWF